MQLLFVKLAFILIVVNPGTKSSSTHTENSGTSNLASLEQIEDLISKKVCAKFTHSHETAFELNGYYVYTKADIHRYAPSVYEESFYNVQNPDNVYRMRLVKLPDGEYEFAVLIKGEEGNINCHAVFNSDGSMIKDDPWGTNEGYTIKIFDIYNQYRNIFIQKVDAQ